MSLSLCFGRPGRPNASLLSLLGMLVLFSTPLSSHAQQGLVSGDQAMLEGGEPRHEALFEQHVDLSRTGMRILGGWALLNIAIGAVGRTQTSGSIRYLHEMNAGWNLVNLSIAGFALMSLQDLAFASLGQAYRESANLDRLLLLNSGLDVAYIATGGYLIERGLRKQDARLQGYGRSLLVQGGFLLIFDLALFALHQPITSSMLEQLETGDRVSLHLSAPMRWGADMGAGAGLGTVADMGADTDAFLPGMPNLLTVRIAL